MEEVTRRKPCTAFFANRQRAEARPMRTLNLIFASSTRLPAGALVIQQPAWMLCAEMPSLRLARYQAYVTLFTQLWGQGLVLFLHLS